MRSASLSALEGGVFGGIDASASIGCYGGNQAWYDKTWQKNCGCGTVTAANIMAYMAHINPQRYGSLYNYTGFARDCFQAHQRDVIRYVRPFRIGTRGLGIWFALQLARGIKKYAKSKGVKLKSHAFNNMKTGDFIVSRIKNALLSDNPVAMVIHFNRSMGIFQRHWVTITAIEQLGEDGDFQVTVSSWGREYKLMLRDILKSSYAGFVYLE